VQEDEAEKTKYSLQKEANIINQKYITQETAAQNIKSQLKSRYENKKNGFQEESIAWTIPSGTCKTISRLRKIPGTVM
jgi:hypothetical protein